MHKDNAVPMAVVNYHNEYRLQYILKGLEILHRDATRKFFVKRALRLSPQLNILRQASLGYGNDVFREMLIRSFIIEAQNTPYYVLEKKARLRKKLSAQQARMAAKLSTERLGYMMRHIKSDMSDEYIERTERSVRDGEIDRLHREMLQEEIDEEERLRDGSPSEERTTASVGKTFSQRRRRQK